MNATLVNIYVAQLERTTRTSVEIDGELLTCTIKSLEMPRTKMGRLAYETFGYIVLVINDHEVRTRGAVLHLPDGTTIEYGEVPKVLRPHCYNRPPRPPFQWMRAGYCSRTLKPRLRPVVTSPTRDRCAAYDAPAGTVPAPVLDGWKCNGCRWFPTHSFSTTRENRK